MSVPLPEGIRLEDAHGTELRGENARVPQKVARQVGYLHDLGITRLDGFRIVAESARHSMFLENTWYASCTSNFAGTNISDLTIIESRAGQKPTPRSANLSRLAPATLSAYASATAGGPYESDIHVLGRWSMLYLSTINLYDPESMLRLAAGVVPPSTLLRLSQEGASVSTIEDYEAVPDVWLNEILDANRE